MPLFDTDWNLIPLLALGSGVVLLTIRAHNKRPLWDRAHQWYSKAQPEHKVWVMVVAAVALTHVILVTLRP